MHGKHKIGFRNNKREQKVKGLIKMFTGWVVNYYLRGNLINASGLFSH